MRRILRTIAIGCIFAGAGEAAAKDTEPCPAGLVCASDPQGVLAAMEEAGFTAELDTDERGNPAIFSSVGDLKFGVLFYDCEGGKYCGSLQLNTIITHTEGMTPAIANAWNSDKRLIQMAAFDDTRMAMRYDMSTIGGLTKKNFSDTLDWWQSMLGDAGPFLEEQLGL